MTCACLRALSTLSVSAFFASCFFCAFAVAFSSPPGLSSFCCSFASRCFPARLDAPPRSSSISISATTSSISSSFPHFESHRFLQSPALLLALSILASFSLKAALAFCIVLFFPLAFAGLSLGCWVWCTGDVALSSGNIVVLCVGNIHNFQACCVSTVSDVEHDTCDHDQGQHRGTVSRQHV